MENQATILGTFWQGEEPVDTALAEPYGAGDGAWRATRGGDSITNVSARRGMKWCWKPELEL